MIDELQWRDAVGKASRAPSPHNAQPARWRLQGREVQLLGDTSGWLAAGDPSGRDDLVALGMAWEAMRLALTARDLALTGPNLSDSVADRSRPGLRAVAHGELLRGATPDPLDAWQDRRRCWRGRFTPASHAQLADFDRCLASFADTAIAMAQTSHRQVARWYDAAASEGLHDPGVARELYAFLRFSTRHPRWERDGLAADCMALSRFEAWGASMLMRPRMVSLLGKLGLLGLVVSEKPKVLSASRLVLIHAACDESPFEAGRRWYRFWLALTAAGFSAVPMSALADSRSHSAQLLALQPLPPGRRLLNVMRIGPSPGTPAPRSARLPVSDLIIRAA